MVKYCCNNFHALKITFANETARLCEALGVDPFEVMDLVCKDRQLNISPAYLKPGFAFGGSCLPKDLRATMYLAKMRDVELPMHGGIMPSNRGHIDHAIAKVLATGKRRVGMIGLSFKTGTDDLRESPLVLIAEHFIGKGLRCWSMIRKCTCPPPWRESPLHRAARAAYRPTHARGYREVIAASDVLVVGLNDAATVAALQQHARPDQVVFDLVGIGRRPEMRAEFVGLCW